MKYYLGVDGGGTKTEFVLINEKQEIISTSYAGKSNPNDIGVEALLLLLVGKIKEIMPPDTESISISMGLSGVAYAGCQDLLIAEIKKIEKVNEVYIESDRRISLDAAFPNKDGAIAIIGTGNSFYIRKGNEYISLAGAGYMYDDSLSGFDIGRLAIKKVIEDIECRGKRTLLTKLVLDKCGSIGEVIKTTYIDGKKFVAEFSKIVVDNIDKDEVCKDIIKEVCSNFDGYLNKVSEYVSSLVLTGGLSSIWNDVFSKYIAKTSLNIEILSIKPVFGCFARFGFDPENIK